MYDFVDVEWTRNTESDAETLRFLPNGEFHYSCACGSPVDDADIVESYTYNESTQTISLNYYDNEDGAITEIKLIRCDESTLELDFDGDIRIFHIANAEDEDAIVSFDVDLTKISPIILENADESIITAATSVIEAFLQYENSVAIEVSGNSQRFMNDMAYVVNCTCPMFGAFTDFNDTTAYDPQARTVSWNYCVEKDEFDLKIEAFYDTVSTYLSKINYTDTETMRALVLYYAMINDLDYNYDLVGDNFEKLNKEEANLKSSPYYVLTEKSGICTNIAQAYMFLCTQADISCGTVLHTGGSAIHMWNIIMLDGQYYYCDPTWDANSSPKHFGITAADRESWAGGYSSEDGTMLSVTIPEKYQVSDSRFDVLRDKLPVETSEINIDQTTQTITFIGYEYEYVFNCN